MVAPSRLAALLLWLVPAISTELADDSPAFAADDECATAPGGGRCGLNALQMMGSRVGGLASAALEKADCQDAAQGDTCFQEIEWAKSQGIQQHPEWYPGMSADMPPADFQWIIHGTDSEKCPEPCSGTKRLPPPTTPAPQAPQGPAGPQGPPAPEVPEPPMPTPPVDPNACLCVFDIDRTLTAKQGSTSGTCPSAETVPNVEDDAYGGGVLALSEFSRMLGSTFCSQCYLGVCSHGDADREYSKERNILIAKLLTSEPMRNLVLKPSHFQWSDEKLLTPFVVSSPDGVKQLHVARIREFYLRQGINIMASNIFFYDDRANNVEPFKGTGMNAKQISCGSRDMDISNGAVGLCGAAVSEIVRENGISLCPEITVADQNDTAIIWNGVPHYGLLQAEH